MLWAWRWSHGLDRRAPHTVEVRVDLPAKVLSALTTVPGWRIAHVNIEREMLFLRREQPLTNRALRLMIREAVVLAHAHGGWVHSWMHAPDLADWDDRRAHVAGGS